MARRLGWVDKPDLRKQHDAAVPLSGGVAILLGFMAAMFVAGEPLYRPLLIGMTSLCLLGLVDDLLDLSARCRLLLQILLVGALAVWKGLHLCYLGNIFGFGEIILPTWLGLVFLVFCIVAVINAINMIDGVDGLAGGVMVITLLWLAFLSTKTGSDTSLMLMLGASIGGYLCFNMRGPFRKKATVFMGDAGSTMLGFGITWLLVIYSRNQYGEFNEFPPVLIPWLLAVPLLDTACLIISRGLRGTSPFKADRDHIHHILMRVGLSDRQAAIVVIAMAFVIGGVGVAGWLLHAPECLLFYGFLLLFAAYYYAVHHRRELFVLFQRLGGYSKGRLPPSQ
ncbi:MAG TPA: MraY family glycosyltransferase [Pseudomonadales bacterium]|nr:MraY family glycosyltransferase [Pseudomonadales bacterium]